MQFFSVAIQMKPAIEQYTYFPVVLFFMLYNVCLIFDSLGEILKCDPSSNESYLAVLSFGGQFIMLYKVVPDFQCLDAGLLTGSTIQMKGY